MHHTHHILITAPPAPVAADCPQGSVPRQVWWFYQEGAGARSPGAITISSHSAFVPAAQGALSRPLPRGRGGPHQGQAAPFKLPMILLDYS